MGGGVQLGSLSDMFRDCLQEGDRMPIIVLKGLGNNTKRLAFVKCRFMEHFMTGFYPPLYLFTNNVH